MLTLVDKLKLFFSFFINNLKILFNLNIKADTVCVTNSKKHLKLKAKTKSQAYDEVRDEVEAKQVKLNALINSSKTTKTDLERISGLVKDLNNLVNFKMPAKMSQLALYEAEHGELRDAVMKTVVFK